MIRHLYIHIPFCQRRCAYCDFNTYANMEHRIEAYVQALCAELAQLRGVAATPPHPDSYPLRPSIYFGGGTPSMLTPGQFVRILEAASALVPLDTADSTEVTIEANPGSVLGNGTDAFIYLRALRSLGINRLSLGVQSLHDPTLRVLGRTHTAAEAYQCFATARRAGFDNISLDFMFGLPGQTMQQWAATLDTIIAWGTDHFSLYSLILEESTPLFAQVMGGRVSLPDDDATAAMYELAMERLAAAGYSQYEISNWACSRTSNGHLGASAAASYLLPQRASQHNLAYWFNQDYLAAGAGAHGHVYPQRYANVPGIDDYIARVQAGQRPVADYINLQPDDLCAETMFMGLRLNAGVSLAHFRARCGVELEQVYAATLRDLQTQGLIEYTPSAVRLTGRGRLFGNQVFTQFVA